jgi:hypothetical protein
LVDLDLSGQEILGVRFALGVGQQGKGAAPAEAVVSRKFTASRFGTSERSTGPRQTSPK